MTKAKQLNSSGTAKTTKLAVTAMLTAMAVVLQYIEFSVPFVPSFLKMDFSDLPELIGTFAFGPLWGVTICLLKNIIHLPFGTSGGVGELSNFLLGTVFAVTAGLIYKHRKNKKTAVVACMTGAVSMAVVGVIVNMVIVYPAYAVMWFGGDMNSIVEMYKTILPSSDTLLKSLVIFNLPFTFVKGLIVSIVTILIYKPLSRAIHGLDKLMTRKSSLA